MTRTVRTCEGFLLVLMLALLAGALGAGTRVSTDDGVSLFTETDAAELRIDENHWDPIPRARSAPLGPVIIIQTPEIKKVEGSDTIQATSPTRFVVHFEENQAPIDMGSLEVTAKKGPFRRSLTDTLKPFVRGNELQVDAVEVPSGKFQIEILIKDHNGRETTQTYRLIVEE